MFRSIAPIARLDECAGSGHGRRCLQYHAKPPLPPQQQFELLRTDKLQFKSCAISNPAAGDWEVTVTREQGQGHFQVIGTIFAATRDLSAMNRPVGVMVSLVGAMIATVGYPRNPSR